MTSHGTRMITRLHLTYVRRHEPEYSRAFADLYWRSLLVIACIIIVGVCAYSAAVFITALPQVNPDTAAAVSTISVKLNLNRTQLDATLSGFTARQTKFQTLQTSPIPPLIDPSQ